MNEVDKFYIGFWATTLIIGIIIGVVVFIFNIEVF